MNYQNEISVYLHIGFLAVMVIVVAYIGYKLVREWREDEEFIEWNNDKHK